jgi:DNA mismatch endonuclease (patch repair protein)
MPDNLTPEQRRKTMQAVKSRDTGLEKTVGSALHKRGLRYRRCVKSLPGTPDFVFRRAKVVVFVDGDFWHGWRFPEWKGKLKPYWQAKIERTRRRDRRNFQRLRRAGWTVLRFWSHQVERDLRTVVERVVAEVASATVENHIRAAQ